MEDGDMREREKREFKKCGKGERKNGRGKGRKGE